MMRERYVNHRVGGAYFSEESAARMRRFSVGFPALFLKRPFETPGTPVSGRPACASQPTAFETLARYRAPSGSQAGKSLRRAVGRFTSNCVR
jgi:hypothetical protein